MSLLKEIIFLQELFDSISFINIHSELYSNSIEIGINNRYYSYKEVKDLILKQLSKEASIITFTLL